MNRRPPVRFVLAAVTIVGLLTVFTRTNSFAQVADQQSQGATPAQLRTFLLFGGAFQQVDAASGLCAGQCGVINQWTGACTCPSGYVPLPSARTLVDVNSGQEGAVCGAFLYICAK